MPNYAVIALFIIIVLVVEEILIFPLLSPVTNLHQVPVGVGMTA